MTRDKVARAIRGQRGTLDSPTGGLLVKEARFELRRVKNVDENDVLEVRIRA
jgi:hypothetical protein